MSVSVNTTNNDGWDNTATHLSAISWHRAVTWNNNFWQFFQHDCFDSVFAIANLSATGQLALYENNNTDGSSPQVVLSSSNTAWICIARVVITGAPGTGAIIYYWRFEGQSSWNTITMLTGASGFVNPISSTELIGHSSAQPPYNQRVSSYKGWNAVLTGAQLLTESTQSLAVIRTNLVIETSMAVGSTMGADTSGSGNNWTITQTAGDYTFNADEPNMAISGGGGSSASIISNVSFAFDTPTVLQSLPKRFAGVAPPGVAARLSPNVVRGPQEPRGPLQLAGGPANPPAPSWRILQSTPGYVETPKGPQRNDGFGVAILPVPPTLRALDGAPVATAPPTPQLSAGAGGVILPVPPVLRALDGAPAVTLPPAPRRNDGFGQKSFVAQLIQDPFYATASYDPVPLPARMPTVYAGVTKFVASIAASFVTAPIPAALPPVPAVYAGSSNDPGTISIGGVLGAFLPDDPQSPVPPARFVGVVPSTVPVQATILRASPPTIATDLPPDPSNVLGFGQAAQPPVVWRVAPAPFAELPPHPASVSGFGLPAQPPVVLRVGPAPATDLPPDPSNFSGFGQPAQVPAIYLSTPPRIVELPPAPNAFVGFGQAAQSPVIYGSAPARPAVELPPDPNSFPGVAQAVPVTAAAVYSSAPPVQPTVPPPAPASVVGFGQPPAIARMVTVVDARAPVAAPTPIAYVGFGQAAQVPVILPAPSLPPATYAPPTQFSSLGFGSPPQVAAVLSTVDPRTAVAATSPSWFAGIVPPATTSGAIIRSSTIGPQDLPPRGSVVSGFGIPPAVARILTAATAAPSVDLLVAGRLVAGFGQPTPLPAPPVLSAPSSAPAATLPPTVTLRAGFGQAAQPPVIYSSTHVVEPAQAPPTSYLAAGVQPVMVTALIVMRATVVDQATAPPAQLLRAGFGKPAQVAVVLASTVPPGADAPPRPYRADGVSPPAVAHVYAPPYWAPFVALPPTVSVFAGFGQAPIPWVAAPIANTITSAIDLTDRTRTIAPSIDLTDPTRTAPTTRLR